MSELEDLRYAGIVNQKAIEAGFEHADVGITLRAINDFIEKVITDNGCVPAFKNYKPEGYPAPFPAAACLSVNDGAVHGIPNDYKLDYGDLLTIDVGTECKGWFVDAARSRVIGALNPLADYLVEATEIILRSQLDIVQNECSLLDLALAAEDAARILRVQIMPQWGGHGIGRAIHMEPFIPSSIDRTKSFLHQNIEEKRYARQKLKSGDIICLEPVVSLGNSRTILDEDQWTVRQADGALVAHTERCLIVTEKGYEILS